MAQTCEEMVAEVKAFLGREGDTVLITDNRCARWLNEAQRDIAERCPGLHELEMKNTAMEWTANLTWPLSEFTSSLDDVTTENRICHTWALYYVDGNDSAKLRYVPIDEFDEIIDPTHSDHDDQKPKRWTRRGNNIEVFPICASDYWGEGTANMRLDGGVYPVDFDDGDDTSTSSLNDADEGLIRYAVSRGWEVIGGQEGASQSVIWRKKYDNWFDDYKTKNDVMHEWEATLYPEIQ